MGDRISHSHNSLRQRKRLQVVIHRGALLLPLEAPLEEVTAELSRNNQLNRVVAAPSISALQCSDSLQVSVLRCTDLIGMPCQLIAWMTANAPRACTCLTCTTATAKLDKEECTMYKWTLELCIWQEVFSVGCTLPAYSSPGNFTGHVAYTAIHILTDIRILLQIRSDTVARFFHV